MSNRIDQAIIVGGGPAGLAAALALSTSGVGCRLVAGPAPDPARPDNRTAALFAGSITFLRHLGVEAACRARSAPISEIRILDDTGRFLRAPDARFTAAQVGLSEFGLNIPNRVLTAALNDALKGRPDVEVIPDTTVKSMICNDDFARLDLSDGRTIEARVVLAADGRNSVCRAAAGIETTSWSYDQAAVTCMLDHTRPHQGISTELHRPAGPLTLVPMPGDQSSLVWVEKPDEAKRLATLSDEAFARELELRLQGLVGRLTGVTARAVFPLSGLTAHPFAARRTMLVGEAGHIIPPIGAQGLNLGLRDAAAAAECVMDAIAAGRDAGSHATLEIYDRMRASDVALRVNAIDLMNRSLLSSWLPVHLLRGAGLAALNVIAPLRDLVVRQGLQPSWNVPRMMR